MSSFESWLISLWPALLALSCSLMLVLSLRWPTRRWLGAESAFYLWLLPPLALLVSMLPHSLTGPLPSPPQVIVQITSAIDPSPAQIAAPSPAWKSLLSLAWMAGVIVVASTMIERQRGYRRRLRMAARWSAATGAWPIMQAGDNDTGPAMVGALRPRIVLPRDFAERYDADERALILAHETMHARRGDGWWCLLANLCLCLFWFHPLVWWASLAMRHDQELACDAAVMREHAGQRRRYALAMLKTQCATAVLPVGCAWSSRHPVVERIAMLKRSVLPRRLGKAGVVATAIILAGAVYAGEQPGPISADARAIAEATHFSVDITIRRDHEPVPMHQTICLARGEHYTLDVPAIGEKPAWHGSFVVEPFEQTSLAFRGTLSGGPSLGTFTPRFQGGPGQSSTILIQNHRPASVSNGPGFDHSFGMGVVMKLGC
jgi:beta-lactamase regulating signal transducer with metallopeptidase domain